jgi:hypothetical protein
MVYQEGAFDEAVKDMTSILHTASPFNYKSDDPKGVLRLLTLINPIFDILPYSIHRPRSQRHHRDPSERCPKRVSPSHLKLMRHFNN